MNRLYPDNHPDTRSSQPSQIIPRVTVGVDFGTTYTAVAWGDSTNAGYIELIDSWPTAGVRTHHSAPTEIAYEEGSTVDYSWGYDIKPGSKKLKWFKLLLDMDDPKYGVLPNDMTVVQVVADFLRALYQHIMQTLNRKLGSQLMSMTEVNFVLTVPASWSDLAKQRTLQAAEAAGFRTNHRLTLLSEPEAAALYCIRYQDNYTIKPNDRIVVCDCGGGTVDIIAYDILQTHPQLQVREAAIGEGEYWGSTCIDRNFQELIEQRLGSLWQQLGVNIQQRVIQNFAEEVKCAFRNRDDQDNYYVSIPTINTIAEMGISNGNLVLKREEVKDLFDRVIVEIVGMLERQVRATSTAGPQVKTILLVGGFGESVYLYDEITRWAATYGINILQPRGAATCIVKGAVMRGLELGEDSAGITKQSQVERLSRRNYGTITSQPFVQGMHKKEDMVMDPITGQKLAKGQVRWFLKKGDRLSDETKVSHSYYRTFHEVVPWKSTLVVSEMDKPPTRVEGDIKVLCRIESDLTKEDKRIFDKKWKRFKPVYTAEYQVNMFLKNGAELQFQLEYKKKVYGSVKVDFD